jgi:hypothetical protein
MTQGEVFEQLLLVWQEVERELAEQMIGDRNGKDEQLTEEVQDWREQWERAE